MAFVKKFGPPPEPTVPAGWLADPERPGYLRYWDGTAWGDESIPDIHNTATRGPVDPYDGGSLETAGWITAILFAPIGVIIGVILMSQGKRNGGWIFGLSLGVIVLYYALILR